MDADQPASESPEFGKIKKKARRHMMRGLRRQRTSSRPRSASAGIISSDELRSSVEQQDTFYKEGHEDGDSHSVKSGGHEREHDTEHDEHEHEHDVEHDDDDDDDSEDFGMLMLPPLECDFGRIMLDEVRALLSVLLYADTVVKEYDCGMECLYSLMFSHSPVHSRVFVERGTSDVQVCASF